MEIKTAIIISVVLAVIAAAAVLFFVAPKKKRESLGTIGKFLHDLVNFKVLVCEKLLVLLYTLITAFVIFYGFFSLFMEDMFLYGLVFMLLGPIAVRLVYELIMLLVVLVKNTAAINNKLADNNQGEKQPDVFDVVTAINNSKPAAPQSVFCPHCGFQNSSENGFCLSCGNKL